MNAKTTTNSIDNDKKRTIQMKKKSNRNKKHNHSIAKTKLRTQAKKILPERIKSRQQKKEKMIVTQMSLSSSSSSLETKESKQTDR